MRRFLFGISPDGTTFPRHAFSEDAAEAREQLELIALRSDPGTLGEPNRTAKSNLLAINSSRRFALLACLFSILVAISTRAT